MSVIDKFKNRSSNKWAKVSTGETKIVLTLNGYRWEGWQSVIELKDFIIFEIRDKFITWQLSREQDPEGKWTMKLIIEVENQKEERVKSLIKQKARELIPSVGVEFKEI